MSELRIEHSPQLTAAEKAFWAGALRESYFGAFAIPWTEAVRAAGPRSLEIHYLQIFSGERRRALAVLHIIRDLDLGRYLGRPAKSLFSLFAKSGFKPLAKDLAFLEVPLTNSSGVRLAPGSEDQARPIAALILKFIREKFRYHILSFKLTPGDPQEKALGELGLVKTAFLANMAIEFRGEQTFVEYVQRLSPRIRTQSRSYRRTFEQAGGTIEILDHLDDAVCGLMHRLHGLTLQHHAEFSNLQLPIPLGPGFFKAVTEGLPGAARVFLAKIHGAPVGFFLVFHSGDHAYFTHCGLDYARTLPTRAYFNLYYALITYSIQCKITRLNLGAEAYTTKQRLGATPFPTAYRFEVRNLVLRVIASFVARNFGAQEGSRL
jgi:predicted N-acyltransferase